MANEKIMMNVAINNWTTIFISFIFWLSPVALTIHLIAKKNMPNAYKIKVAYFYAVLWAIAIAYYLNLFLTSS